MFDVSAPAATCDPGGYMFVILHYCGAAYIVQRHNPDVRS